MGLVTVVTVALMAVLAAIAQPAVAQTLSIGTVFPDAVVVCLVVAGLLLGPTEALAIGFIVGLISTTQIGHAGMGGVLVSRCLVALLAGHASARVYVNSGLAQVAAVFVGALVGEITLFAFSPDPSVLPWLWTALGRATLSALIAPLFFRVAHSVAVWERGDAHRPSLGG